MNKFSFSKCCLVILFLTITYQVAAEDTLTITIEEAVSIALSENLTIKVADREIERKDYMKKERVSGLIPALNATGSFQRNFKNQVMTMTVNDQVNTIEIGAPNTFNGTFNLSLPIIAPTLWQNIRLSEVDIERSVEAARASKIDLIAEVKSAYYAAMLTKDSYNVLLKNYKQAKENARIIKERFNQGVASEYEVIRSEVSVRNLEPSLLQAETGVGLSLLRLKVLIGIDLNLSIDIHGTLTDYESDLTREIIEDHPSMNNNTSLRKLDIEAKYLERTYKVQRSQRLPSLFASGAIGYMAMEKRLNVFEYNWRSFSNAGLTLSIPIFEGMAKSHREKQTRIAIDAMKMQREEAERNLTLAYVSQNEEIRKTMKQIASNKEGMAMADQGYMIALKRYEVGSGSFIELNDAELAALQSKLTYNQALHDYLIAKNNLESLLGNFDTETNRMDNK